MSKTAVKNKQARKRAEKRNKRSKRNRNKAVNHSPETRKEKKMTGLKVLGLDPLRPMKEDPEQFWGSFRASLAAAYEIVDLIGWECLSKYNAISANLYVEGSVEDDYGPGVIIEVETEQDGIGFVIISYNRLAHCYMIGAVEPRDDGSVAVKYSNAGFPGEELEWEFAVAVKAAWHDLMVFRG